MLMRNFTRKLRFALPTVTIPDNYNSHQFAADVFQRIPPFSQLAVLLIAIFGPTHAPILFSFLIVFVHGVFVASNARTAWGMRFACKAVEKCAGTNWREASGSITEFDQVRHLVILPNYKETLDTLRETLSVLASHPNARASYRICLASEAAEAGVTEKVTGLIEEFGACFLELHFTLHPRNLPGEAAGKSSNVSWAAKEMFSRGCAGDIITVMDADSCFASDWFAATASKYVQASSETRRALMFVAPIFFDRNASDVAAPVACTDILWCAAGLGTMFDGSRAKLPTSAYGMATQLATRIGFWDTGPESIGEDLHMSVKAFFETNGALRVEPIYSPASQCNVVGFRYPPGYNMPWHRAHEWTSDLFARYSQAKRHMWGALDSGYALRRLALGKFGVHSDIPSTGSESALEDGFRTDDFDSRPQFTTTIKEESGSRSQTPDSAPTPQSDTFDDSGFTSSYTSPATSVQTSPLLNPAKLSTAVPALNRSPISNAPLPLFNLFILMSRLYEAHFNLGYLFILLSIAPFFNPGLEPTPLWKLRPTTTEVVEAQLLPASVLVATAISSHLGTMAFICTASIFYYYERFHHITTTQRWEGRPHLGQRAYQQTVRKLPWCLLTYAAVPFTLLFGILPLYHAQLCHIWSNKIVYQVSAKPNAAPGNPSRYVPIAMEDIQEYKPSVDV